jgi:hypothetical protein
MPVKLARSEEGYTMISVVGAIALVTMLVGAALAATNADLNLVRRDLDDKRAYAAAQAGVADYSFHLNNDNGYWKYCAPPVYTGPAPVNPALNLEGSTNRTRAVPGATGNERYAIELLHADSTSQQCNPSAPPFYNMLEQSGTSAGTFRIRSTGFAGVDRNGDGRGDVRQSIVATFKKASFLDFVYFTQLETSDPVTYGFPPGSQAEDGAYEQCDLFRREGRQSQPIPGTGQYCTTIVFADDDDIDGPLHTNDDLCIESGGTPSFGRDSADVIEVSSPPRGYGSPSGTGCGGNASQPSPGTFITNAPVLEPPPTNADLRNFAGPSYTYTGQTRIELTGNSMRINGGSSISLPPSGVVYVANGSCSTSYSPFTATYPTSSGCGNAIVKNVNNATYSGALTIAAENDIIIDGTIRRNTSSPTAVLGLVANNFVRVRHAYPNQDGPGDCNGDTGETRLEDLRIDAAILAIDHSFIVDHYDCGDQLGELEVNGAIAQKYRGPVGTVGGHGYLKDYNYDDRLRYTEPPHFFDPIQFAWRVQRETLDFD